jgi:hypothetical protein
MNNSIWQPKLPDSIMQDLIEKHAEAAIYNPDNGGQYTQGTVADVPFRGCIMPLNEDDLKRAPQGTYTKNSRKIYTNGHRLTSGVKVYDPSTGDTYTITGDLNHGSISSIMRYTAERKGAAAP